MKVSCSIPDSIMFSHPLQLFFKPLPDLTHTFLWLTGLPLAGVFDRIPEELRGSAFAFGWSISYNFFRRKNCSPNSWRVKVVRTMFSAITVSSTCRLLISMTERQSSWDRETGRGPQGLPRRRPCHRNESE